MENPIYLIVITIFIVLSIWFLTIKYFLYPLFFKPKLSLNETFEFFERGKIEFVDKREPNKREKKINPFNYKKGFSFKKMFSERTEYIVIGFSESKKEYYFFWLELTQWYYWLHMKFFIEFLTEQKLGKRRILVYKEIEEEKILTELKNFYEKKTVLITDQCPGCENTVSDKITVCPNCGLNLVA